MPLPPVEFCDVGRGQVRHVRARQRKSGIRRADMNHDLTETNTTLVFQGDCWICMELMSTSLDKFYKYVYCALDNVIPEEILGKITLAVSRGLLFLHCAFVWSAKKWTAFSLSFPQQTVKALNHLKENLKIIHRGKFKKIESAFKCITTHDMAVWNASIQSFFFLSSFFFKTSNLPTF